MSDEYRIALARALGRHEKDAGIAGEPVIAALAHASRVKAMEAEIERLRKRLELPREADAKEIERLRAALRKLYDHGYTTMRDHDMVKEALGIHDDEQGAKET